MTLLSKLICFLAGHRAISDDTWGGYGWTCRRCGKNDYSIHDM